MKGEVNVIAMRELYDRSPTAKKIMDAVFQEIPEFSRLEVLVDDLVAGLRLDRRAVIQTLRVFGLHNCGQFVTGRRKKASRFRWSCPSDVIVKQIIGQPSKSPEAAIGQPVFVEHKIWLRPGVQVTVQMPGDTTRDEAQKIAGVVSNLWLGDPPSKK